MKRTQIAKFAPFEGAPKINLPLVIGASAGKEIIIRIATTGKRPISFKAEGLLDTLLLEDNIIRGKVDKNGEYKLKITAENSLGKDEKEITLEIGNGVLITPLMGFTTWNAFGSEVSQADVLKTANKMVELGISEYGYSYVNTDSGWQHKYGGEFDAVMPNPKFPEMKKMTDKLHALGFKAGIYSTPMLTAWGCPKEYESIPGCTVGAPDYRFSSLNGGIGTVRKEKNNAKQWDKWGFDYLKYDFSPTDPVNVELMRKELVNCERDFGLCVTVKALPDYHEYWSKYVCSYRSNEDALGNFERLKAIYNTYFTFVDCIKRGHYFDLDMLDIGEARMTDYKREYTFDECVLSYSIRAFLNSPIQISSVLENASEDELSIYCNEEIIAINQDVGFNTSVPVLRKNMLDVFEKQLFSGEYAYGIFNMSEREEAVTLSFETEASVYDVWAKAPLDKTNKISFTLAPHTVRIIKASKKAEVK